MRNMVKKDTSRREKLTLFNNPPVCVCPVKSQLAHDIVTTLGFVCILVATSDNVVTTLPKRCVSNVVATTKN